MRFKMIIAVTGAAVLAAPAFAADDATPKPEKKICRRQEVTGSIMGSKAICHTRTEWQKIDQANGDSAGKTLDRDRQLRTSGVGNTRDGG